MLPHLVVMGSLAEVHIPGPLVCVSEYSSHWQPSLCAWVWVCFPTWAFSLWILARPAQDSLRTKRRCWFPFELHPAWVRATPSLAVNGGALEAPSYSPCEVNRFFGLDLSWIPSTENKRRKWQCREAILSSEIHIQESLKECSWETGSLLVRASEGDSHYKTFQPRGWFLIPEHSQVSQAVKIYLW